MGALKGQINYRQLIILCNILKQKSLDIRVPIFERPEQSTSELFQLTLSVKTEREWNFSYSKWRLMKFMTTKPSSGRYAFNWRKRQTDCRGHKGVISKIKKVNQNIF